MLCFSMEFNPKSRKFTRTIRTAFEKNRSITSSILTIRLIVEGIWAKNLVITQVFVDFSKTFDFLPRGKMDQILPAYGLSKEILTFNKDTLQNQENNGSLT